MMGMEMVMGKEDVSEAALIVMMIMRVLIQKLKKYVMETMMIVTKS